MRIALCQIASEPDPTANLEQVSAGVRRAAAAGAELAVFPEATMACFGTELASLAEPVNGRWANEVRKLAGEHGIAVVAGMFTPTTDNRVTNTLLLAGRGLDASYDKIHLFDAFGFAESNTVAPGSDPIVADLDGVKIGMSTCYDVRFPQLYTTLADRGATIMITAASWGSGEGKRAQWELLTRARALDSTSWVLACDQADPRSIGRTSHGTAPTGIGYSLVATPTGEIHAQLAAEPDVLVVDIDPAAAEHARQNIPVLANRRF